MASSRDEEHQHQHQQQTEHDVQLGNHSSASSSGLDHGSTQDSSHDATQNGTAWTPPLPSFSSTTTARQEHPDHHEQPNHQPVPTNPKPSSALPPPLDPDSFPGRRKSSAGISLRAWSLGQAFGAGLLLVGYLLYHEQPLWRIPFFVATVALFHFLEFWTTARYNTRYATVSAFLLSSNGTAYNIAHAAAVTECLLSYFSGSSTATSSSSWAARLWGPWPISITVLGLCVTALGQVTRSWAMVHAGTNFNHIVQTKRSDDHQLVTTGIYAYLRHPSYFGFFWWGLGTQIVMGNRICLVAYAFVLWRFFARRIASKSAHSIMRLFRHSGSFL